MEQTPIQRTNDLHKYSDRDSSRLAQHHTLGPKQHQASPGDHIHDGNGSLVLSIDDLPFIDAGVVAVSFTNLTSTGTTVSVSFNKTFASAPYVTTNITSGAAVTGQWHSRAISVTTTGFNMFVFHNSTTSTTWSNVPVQWIAVLA